MEDETIKTRKLMQQGVDSDEELPSMNYTASINDFRLPM